MKLQESVWILYKACHSHETVRSNSVKKKHNGGGALNLTLVSTFVMFGQFHLAMTASMFTCYSYLLNIVCVLCVSV